MKMIQLLFTLIYVTKIVSYTTGGIHHCGWTKCGVELLSQTTVALIEKYGHRIWSARENLLLLNLEEGIKAKKNYDEIKKRKIIVNLKVTILLHSVEFINETYSK